ncbi:MAG: type IV pili methyl-accepting chemotaxis transducer N-terminal domain-containing protein [Nitrospinae bacterium]|nr:type IV pili methyl-accepting chemotaxis transducer N-terminal domain-containing protein [Nitrospinota bacterium]
MDKHFSRIHKLKYITIRYVAALSLIATLVILGHVTTRLIIHQNEADANLINLSGRQRMLSQKLTKTALLFAQTTDKGEIEIYRGTIRASLDEWTTVQAGLQNGNEALGLPKNTDKKAEGYFAEMNPYFQNVKDGLEKLILLKTSDSGAIPLSSPPLKEIVEASPQFLDLMNMTVFEFQKRADERVTKLKNSQTVVTLFAISLLIMEALFIFRPMAKNVQNSYDELLHEMADREVAENLLKSAKENLERTVRERVADLTAANERLGAEISERMRDEEILRGQYEEKELLLREIHHRVKNNLQIVASILRLKSRNIKDPKDLEQFKESEALVRSISLLHEKLYKPGGVSDIMMGEYFSEMVSTLAKGYEGVGKDKIKFTVSAEGVSLGADYAIPCGIVMNELVTNIIKHAFPGGKKGNAWITASSSPDGAVEILVEDDGVGMRRDVGDVGSFGLDLVTQLVKDQLQGTIDFERGEKTTIRIRFNKNA